MAAHNVYTEELACLGHGHALWEPSPTSCYEQVAIGDVGYTRDGIFHRLFNVHLPLDHPTHCTWGVPTRFQPLPRSVPASFRKNPLEPGLYHSNGVRTILGGINVSVNVPISPSTGFAFEFTRRQGAALVLLDKAYREEAYSMEIYKEYMIESYSSWLEFANNRHRLGLRLSGLVLVTGCDKTTKWATAAFSDTQTRMSADIGVNMPGSVCASFSLAAGWQTECFVHRNWGPQESVPSTSLVRPEGEIPHIIDGAQHGYDQCVFVRGFRMKKRHVLGLKSIKAASGFHDLGRRDEPSRDSDASFVPAQPCDTDSDDYAGDRMREIERIPDINDEANALMPILDYILDHSDADITISHDEDFLASISDPDDLELHLQIFQPAVGMSGNVGSLQSRPAKTVPPVSFSLGDLGAPIEAPNAPSAYTPVDHTQSTSALKESSHSYKDPVHGLDRDRDRGCLQATESQGNCLECRALHIRCTFNPGSETCQRCTSAGIPCTVDLRSIERALASGQTPKTKIR